MRLISVCDVLAPGLNQLTPASAERVSVADASGALLAETIVATQACPARAVALRAGFAIAALDVVGASPNSPVAMELCPPRVEPGDDLPADCDAILPDEAVDDSGAFIEITRDAAPGQFVRLAGHDLAAGTRLGVPGDQLTPLRLWTLRLAKIDSVDVIRPRIALNVVPGPNRDWLRTVLADLGCAILLPDHPPDGRTPTAHLVLATAADTVPRVALNPGETASVTWSIDAPPVVALPRRFDGLVGAFHALALPIIDRLRGARVPLTRRPLVRKLSSGVGITEVVLLKSVPQGYLPLAVGDLTLTAIFAADAVALIPPQCEGFAAGTLIDAMPLASNPPVQPVSHE